MIIAIYLMAAAVIVCGCLFFSEHLATRPAMEVPRMPDRSALASTSVARHLTRGAIGFGLIGSALALTPSVGPASLLLVPLGMVALRGCPTCWIAGLIETISAGRLRRTCTDTGCMMRPPPTPLPITTPDITRESQERCCPT